MSDNLETIENPDQNADQSIFESQFHALMDGFGQACEDNKVPVAFAIAIHPDNPRPIVFARGHTYDITILVNKVLNNMKYELMKELNADYMDQAEG